MQLFAGVAVVVAMLVAPLSVHLGAHHGWGGQSDKEFEVTGVVETPLSLAGPHGTMKVRAGSVLWELTLAPPNRTSAAGLKEGVIPVGATVTAHGHRSQDPKRFEVKTERVTWNTRVFNVYPDRN